MLTVRYRTATTLFWRAWRLPLLADLPVVAVFKLCDYRKPLPFAIQSLARGRNNLLLLHCVQNSL
jgi:hypothetical protein